MPASELAGWIDYHQIFPFDDDRADFRMAKTLEMLNSVAKGFVQKQGSWKFFMPDYLNEFNLAEMLEQRRIQQEIAYAEYLETLDNDGNQTSRPSI